MSHVAFYAPLKSPWHPTPSGDRQIARNLMAALELGLERPVRLASELRSFEREGLAEAQDQIRARAEAEVAHILEQGEAPAIWVSYHNYYKSPDLIGPAVTRTLQIPYVLIEATRARSRLTGPWAQYAARAEEACDAADVIFHFTENDVIALSRDRVQGQQIVALPPFLNRHALPPASDLTGPMLAVGMMRHKDKLASYTLIAEACARLQTSEWRLDIAGDGAARAEVEALFDGFGDRVRFLGALPADALQAAYETASLFVWPGVNEAFGMVYLEAQATGLPVVAQNRVGVRDVLRPGPYPDPGEGASALARRMDALLANRDALKAESVLVRQFVESRHLLPAAAKCLKTHLESLIGEPV